MTILLIDADITAYHAVAGAEEEIQWEDDIWTIHTDLAIAKDTFNKAIEKYRETLGVDEYKVCFSDSINFRKELNPTYKGNRKGRKPVGYSAFKEWAMEEHPSFSKPTLEADDCLGILSTKLKDKAIVISMDKDLLSIPGRLYKLSADGTGEMLEVSEKDADLMFYTQCLTGDVTDGYGGCPGIGPKKAEELLKKHGAVWATVEQAYIKAGLTKEDALLQARMARILRNTDWDFKNDKMILWTP